MLDVVIECCEELQTLLKEFKNFKQFQRTEAKHYPDEYIRRKRR